MGKIKVAGYVKKQVFNNQIEYRDFSPDLVGFQLASKGGTPLFTMGNFGISTNFDDKLSKVYRSGKLSNFITLNDLDLTVSTLQELVNNNFTLALNLDYRRLDYYALFGSMTEYLRVTLEDIILKWPASLYILPYYSTDNIIGTITAQTAYNYSYDVLSDSSTFNVLTNTITNKFGITYLQNGTVLNNFNVDNGLRNLTTNFDSYVIFTNGVEYPVIGFTGSTTLSNSDIYFKVKGNPFTGTSIITDYHIKPSKLFEDTFFNNLNKLGSNLLNRKIIPNYTAEFNVKINSDIGFLLYTNKKFTWPVTDGYNIDFDTTYYETYLNSLLELTNAIDSEQTNLINRFLVAESITSFDTSPVNISGIDQDETGGKINKLLQVYGVSFDNFNNYITGLQYINTVTYDKQNNTPDLLLKYLARTLGWNLLSSVLDNDVLLNYLVNDESTYTGLTVGYTPIEKEYELWRRLILNTPWIWKSKGTRKTIEFILRFIGAPNGLISLNEYIYIAKNKIDINQLISILELNGLSTDLSLYSVDNDGYPLPLENTSDLYFQGNGLWYRETGGVSADIDILEGNNPHIGPYDRGNAYLNQFRVLIPNFTPTFITGQTITNNETDLFTNYNLGTMDFYSGDTYVDVISDDNIDVSDCFILETTIIEDPKPTLGETDCGCLVEGDDKALSICVDVNENGTKSLPCSDLSTLAPNGQIKYLDEERNIYVFYTKQYKLSGGTISEYYLPAESDYINPICCEINDGKSYLYYETDSNDYRSVTDNRTYNILNRGYICCKPGIPSCGNYLSCRWEPILADDIVNTTYQIGNNYYLVFLDENNDRRVVSPDGLNCFGYNDPNGFTTRVNNILDPYTNNIGYGCRLNIQNMDNYQNGGISEAIKLIKKYYFNKAFQNISCNTMLNIIEVENL